MDKRYHKVDETNIDNVDEGAKILANMLRQVEKFNLKYYVLVLMLFLIKVKKKHPNWSHGWHLRGAVAAYNFGSKNVQTKSGIDRGSAKTCKPCGGNYSWDTLQRARWLAAKEKTMQMQ